jgi:hypothetical protein
MCQYIGMKKIDPDHYQITTILSLRGVEIIRPVFIISRIREDMTAHFCFQVSCNRTR